MFEPLVTRALSRLGRDQRGADPHPHPRPPMLLQKAEEMRASRDWLFERKWDGFREHEPMRPTAVADKLPS
jgi:ATP-dependent DNA ligase